MRLILTSSTIAKTFITTFLLVIVSSLNSAHAWSGSGHRFIAQTAWSLMTPEAQTMANTLINSGIDAPGTTCTENTFVNSATWLDCVRGAIKVAPWDKILHADRYPLCPGIFPNGERPHYSSDALKQAISNINDRGAPISTRRVALKIILHLVGDLHQPLHSATTFDHLGGDTLVLTPQADQWPNPINLHEYWDVYVARYVRNSNKNAMLAIINSDRRNIEQGSIDSWMAETAQQALNTAYAGLLGMSQICQRPSTTPIVIPQSYDIAARQVGTLKMAQASVRLAYILNQVAAGTLDPSFYAPRQNQASNTAQESEHESHNDTTSALGDSDTVSSDNGSGGGCTLSTSARTQFDPVLLLMVLLAIGMVYWSKR